VICILRSPLAEHYKDGSVAEQITDALAAITTTTGKWRPSPADTQDD